MKKFLAVLVLLMLAQVSFAYETDETKDGRNQKLITEIGFRLLNANRIPYRMIFVVTKNKQINSYTRYSDNKIVIHDEVIKYAQTEDELAGVIAKYISHGVDYRQGVLKGYFTAFTTSLNSKKYEYKADKRAVDYLVKAGYNPVAYITIMNRILPQTRFEVFSSKPVTSRRLAKVYEYIYTKYPEYLVQNEYKNNIYYQNFLLTSKENRTKLEQKVKNNSKASIKYL